MNKRLTKQQKLNLIEGFFDTFYGFISKDINNGIKSGSKYLVALGLATYTEVFGGLIRGKLGIKSESRRNFNAMFNRLSTNKETYQKKSNLIIKDEFGKERKIEPYEYFRCGLVHEYFIKGAATIFNDPKDYANERKLHPDSYQVPGIRYDQFKKKVYIFTNTYWRDLKKSINEYKNELLKEKNDTRINNFIKCVRRLNKRALL